MEIGRIKIAVEFLKEGQSFSIGDLRLGINRKHNMYVTGFSQYLNLTNLTRHEALKELNDIKQLFAQIANTSQELKEFIQDKTIKYNLAFDYGMGAIGICSEKDGTVIWEMELK